MARRDPGGLAVSNWPGTGFSETTGFKGLSAGWWLASWSGTFCACCCWCCGCCGGCCGCCFGCIGAGWVLGWCWTHWRVTCIGTKLLGTGPLFMAPKFIPDGWGMKKLGGYCGTACAGGICWRACLAASSAAWKHTIQAVNRKHPSRSRKKFLIFYWNENLLQVCFSLQICRWRQTSTKTPQLSLPRQRVVNNCRQGHPILK